MINRHFSDGEDSAVASRRTGGPVRRRILRRTALAALALVGVFAIDRLGVFGAGGDDFTRYDNHAFRVVKHVDGDTFDVDIPDPHRHKRTTRLRLWGVDTPETVKPGAKIDHFGPEASLFTDEQTTGKIVRLHLLARHTRDKYGRLLVYVDLPDGQMLNRVLVERGYAYADPRFGHPYQREFATLMNQARHNRRGLWADYQEADLPEYLRERGVR
jgi:micrococcal nuclease